MRAYQSLESCEVGLQISWDFIPKRRKQALFQAVLQHSGKLLHALAKQKGE